jgi:hypothetical protein
MRTSYWCDPSGEIQKRHRTDLSAGLAGDAARAMRRWRSELATLKPDKKKRSRIRRFGKMPCLGPVIVTVRRLTLISWLLVVAGLAASALAAPTAADAERARLIGVLVHTRVAIQLEAVAVEDALRLLSAAIGEPITGRYSSDAVGHGIEPRMPVTVQMDDVSALLALEMILEQAAADEPVTWQLRPGRIEVGTKERLGSPAAAELRTYDIRQLMLEPPYFATTPPPSTAGFFTHPYNAAAITRPVEAERSGVPGPIAALGAGSYTARKKPELLLEELVEMIVEVVEPGNWDYGQQEIDDLGDEEDDGDAASIRRPSIDRTKIARLRVYEDKLVIVAPDFIHRQVAGYPPPTPPQPLTDQELRDRAAKAAIGESRITVIGVTSGPERTDP